MLQMSKQYEPEFKRRLYVFILKRTNPQGLAAEYGVSKASISIWVKQFREECQTNEEAKADYDFMKENLKLKRQLAELQKENDFLKKRRHSLRRKSISGLSIYSAVWAQIRCPLVIEKTEHPTKCLL